MKFLVIISCVLLCACGTPDIDNTVKNLPSETSIYLQQLPKDTVVVSISEDRSKMYVFDEQNKVKYVLIANDSQFTMVNPYILGCLVGICIWFLIGIAGNVRVQ